MLKPIQIQTGDIKKDMAIVYEYLRQMQKEYNHDIEIINEKLREIEVSLNGIG